MSAEKMRPCRCHCGEELVIACPKGCENAELGATAEPDPISRVRAPRGEERKRAKRRARAIKPPPVARICTRCGREIPRSKGRPPKFHEACLTLSERNALAYKRKWNVVHGRGGMSHD